MRRSVDVGFSDNATRHGSHNPYFPKQRHFSGSQRPIGARAPRKDVWVHVGIVFFIVAIFVVFLNYVQAFKVVNVSVEGNHYITENEIATIVHEKLDRKWLFFLDRDVYFFVGEVGMRRHIEEKIADNFALKSVTVKKSFPHDIHVTLEERVPKLVWVSDNQYFYIDPSGVVTQKTQPDQLDETFPKIFDHNNSGVDVNKKVISENLTQLVLRLHEDVPKSAGVAVDTFFILPVQCEQKQTIEKRVRLDQLEEGEVARIESEKRHIQELLQNDEITVDESLELLETLDQSRLYTNEEDEPLRDQNINQEEASVPAETPKTVDSNANVNAGAGVNTNQPLASDGFAQLKEKIIFENTYTPAPCDVASVARDVGIGTVGGWDIYFTTDDAFESQMSKFLTVLREKYPEEPRYLTYIDLRFGDKVYYQ